jgi:hypothetical protein
MDRRAFLKTGAIATAVSTLPLAVSIEGCTASWIAAAEKDVPVLVEIAESIIAIIADATGNGTLAAAASAVIAPLANTVLQELQALQAAITAYQKGTGVLSDIENAVTDVAASLSSFLAPLGTLVSGTLAATLQAALSSISILFEALELLIPSSAASIKAKAAGWVVQTKPEFPSAESMKFLYNSLVVKNGFGNRQVK